MNTLEQISCQLIAAAGSAKSDYFEAIEAAKNGNFDEAEKHIQHGAEVYLQGHAAHAELLQLSAVDQLEVSLLLVHAEDQMMNCETMRTLADEIIAIYRNNRSLKEELRKLQNVIG